MSGENWIRVAMSDDSMVAEALLRLRHSEPKNRVDASPLKLKWSVRQRRSKKGDQTRASPTTPLSWSGATSLSGGGGSGGSGAGATTMEGLEESSAAVKPSEPFRSKVCPIISLIFLFIRFETPRRSYLVGLVFCYSPRDAAFCTVMILVFKNVILSVFVVVWADLLPSTPLTFQLVACGYFGHFRIHDRVLKLIM
ncbi:hypothetical protein; 14670-15257 [Arabidopsis thaliana]|jgi:hypothetical protein|uniref:Uncharacterized protein T21F11.6 n=1 Tax=Arabidopsis thaliana TaxID=3702 RepID=Q9M8M8_ARATH|nr:hypothetical protein; 14670-15257 [Arabidopsis thaliana]